ncbi:MAG: hypothetical protein LUC17_02775 [Oscillospiraceae bacterium]|nr:hypothetical protein [Oscillospiraceae bacterium]
MSNVDRTVLSACGREVVPLMRVCETVSPYGQMMEALKEYINTVIESTLGLSAVIFIAELPDTGYGDHLYIVTSEAAAYIWEDDEWLPLGIGKTPTYEGETTVIPKVAEATVLETANTIMEDDVTVTKIPVSDVDNNSGGKTVTIGL